MSASKHRRSFKNPYVRKCPRKTCKGYMAEVVVVYQPSKRLVKEYECLVCTLYLPKRN